MKKRIAVSVIIPVYNRAHLIAATIGSVLAQTFSNFEIIVVDDGSTDDVSAVLQSIPDDRIIYVRQLNRGASAARNRGIDNARGTYVAFLDSDDCFLPNHLERAIRALDGGDSTAIYAPVIAVRDEGVSVIKPPRGLKPGEDMAVYLMCDRGFVQTSGLVLHRLLARQVRYREDARFGDDTDFAIRLQRAGCSFKMSDQPGAIWSDGAAQPRLSSAGISDYSLPWLEDLKPMIPIAAYNGYRGWHLAKALFRRHPLKALHLYAIALQSGSYGVCLAATVFCQIVVPPTIYRRLANMVIRSRNLLHLFTAKQVVRS